MRTTRWDSRRTALRSLPGLLAIALMAFHSTVVEAQELWPRAPIRLLIPFPPGGSTDSAGRLLATELASRLGQPVLVENLPGAGTAIAAERLARATPDGYTLMLAPSGQLTVLPLTEPRLKFDPVKSFEPVALVASVPYLVPVASSSEIHTLADLVAAAKVRPLSYSSCGAGSVCNVTGELLNHLAGIHMLHVPFQGSAPAIMSVLGGHVQVAVDTEAVQLPQVKAGKLRALVTTTERRSAVLPNVPAAAEAGYPDLIASLWLGVVTPAGTPQAVVERLNAMVNESVRSGRMASALAELGMTPLGGSPQKLAAAIQTDLRRWAPIVEKTGMRN